LLRLVNDEDDEEGGAIVAAERAEPIMCRVSWR